MRSLLPLRWYTVVILINVGLLLILLGMLLLWIVLPRVFGLAVVAQPVHDVENITSFITSAAEHRVIVLGASTYGTAEYYFWRSDITEQLIVEHGARLVFIEGDWSYVQVLNDYIHGEVTEDDLLGVRHATANGLSWTWDPPAFNPFLVWLREYNAVREPDDRVYIYGLSIDDPLTAYQQLLQQLSVYDESLVDGTQRHFECLSQYNFSISEYAAAYQAGTADCQAETRAAVDALRQVMPREEVGGMTRVELAVLQTVLALEAAEQYARAQEMETVATNIRTNFMNDTILRLSTYQQQYSDLGQAVVWVHNRHGGDSRAVQSASETDHYSLGEQLQTELWPDTTFSIGFGTYAGTVRVPYESAAASDVVMIPPARAGSLEHRLAIEAGEPVALLDLTRRLSQQQLRDSIWQRMVLLGYEPALDSDSYIESRVTEQYDAFFFISTTTAVDVW